jgi:hypothetical protein
MQDVERWGLLATGSGCTLHQPPQGHHQEANDGDGDKKDKKSLKRDWSGAGSFDR